jgi:N-acetylglutamate synthase
MIGEEMVLRNMEVPDYGALMELWSRFPGNTMTGADNPDDFADFLRRNGKYCFVAVAGTAVVGSVMAGNDGRRGYVYHLAVNDELQGRGMGRKLMDACENELRRDGIEKAHLFIYADNPAISFYEKVGWHRRTDIVTMSKVLIGDKYMGTRRVSNKGQDD